MMLPQLVVHSSPQLKLSQMREAQLFIALLGPNFKTFQLKNH